jgi:hypothetical protein
MKSCVCMAVALCAALASLGAQAQEQAWLADRRYGEGIGIRSGNLELHPSVAGEFGYDSNYFQRSGTSRAREIDEEVIDVLRLRLTPALSLSTLGEQRRSFDAPSAEPPKVDFDGRVAATYNHLFALDSEHAQDVSRQRGIGVGAQLKLDILPTKPWGGELYGDLLRTVEPSNSPDAQLAWNRDMVRLGAMVAWRPGGGLFGWLLGYEWRYNYFESSSYRYLNNFQQYLKTKGHWKFLPRTALVYDAELGWISYVQNTGYLNNSTPVRSRIGINGLITAHLGLLAMLGWGASFYSGAQTPVQDYDSLIAQGELRWYLRPHQGLPDDAAQVGLSGVALGYVRDFQDSHLTDFYQYDRCYAKLDYSLAGMVVVSGQVGWSRYAYPASFFPGPAGPPVSVRHQSFNENRVDASLFAEYRLSNTVGVNTTLRYDANLTETLIPTVDQTRLASEPAPPGWVGRWPPPQRFDNLKFARFQVFLGARWFM